jgi:hypothetical protein
MGKVRACVLANASTLPVQCSLARNSMLAHVGQHLVQQIQIQQQTLRQYCLVIKLLGWPALPMHEDEDEDEDDRAVTICS